MKRTSAALLGLFAGTILSGAPAAWAQNATLWSDTTQYNADTPQYNLEARQYGDRAGRMARELEALIRAAEQYRAADPKFIADLKALAAQYREGGGGAPERPQEGRANAGADQDYILAPDPANPDRYILTPRTERNANATPLRREERQAERREERQAERREERQAERQERREERQAERRAGGAANPDSEEARRAERRQRRAERQAAREREETRDNQNVFWIDSFKDNDYTNNPAWVVRQGAWRVDPEYGLRAVQSITAERRAEVTPQDLLQILLTGQQPAQNRPSSGPVAALIEAPVRIDNAFQLNATITDHDGKGAAHFILHQGGQQWLGYRLELRGGANPRMVLTRRGSSGYRDLANVAIPSYVPRDIHHIRWIRRNNGKMEVRLNNESVITAEDNAFRDAWTGFAFFNAGGDVSMDYIRIADK